jgi:CHAT domain-containing protein
MARIKAFFEQLHFLLKVLILIGDSNGDPKVVYPMLRQNLSLINENIIEMLKFCIDTQSSETDKSTKESITAIICKFGNLIQQFSLGDVPVNIEIAIACYELSLDIFTSTENPKIWGEIQNSFATAYSNRIKGDKAKNLEKSISHYELAQQVITKYNYPITWAMIQNNLGLVYEKRIMGNKADNLEQSIHYYELALEIFTRQDSPINWGEVHINLANVYGERIRGDKRDNLEQSINCYKEALEIFTKNDPHLDYWATIQVNLANAYGNRIKKDRMDNLELSIRYAISALEILTEKDSPIEWAQAQNNLANAYSNRMKEDRAENLELSIEHYISAARIFTKEDFPTDWAMTQNNLAIVYNERIKGDRTENVERSIQYYKFALEIYTKQALPIPWAMTQNNLAVSYGYRIKGSRAENLEKSIECYKSALEIYTKEDFPFDWAMTQDNLASVYGDRLIGDRSENFEQAIKCYTFALKVRTKEDFPFDWAMTQNNLANTYQNCIEGNEEHNLEKTIDCYQQALTIYTATAFPKECKNTASLLANLQSEIGNWSQATEAYNKALTAVKILYQSCTFLYSKTAELEKTADLPRRAAYAFAKTGDLQEALLTIETGRARGLSESLERDRANLLQLAQVAPDLADRYQDVTQQIRNIEAEQRRPETPEQLQSITTEDQRNNVTNLRAQLQEAIEQIRQQSGYENFLLPPTIEDIFAASQPHQPIVYLIPTPNGSLGLIVMPQEIVPVWIDDFTEASLQELAQSWFGTYSGQDRTTWQKEIDRGTQTLWQVMEPIVDCLKSHNLQQAILIPTGLFSLFPLHAAWKEDPTTITKRHYALDSICFSYVPNARSITECRSIANRVTPDTLLAIDEPTHQGAKPLPNSSREVVSVISTFPNSIVLRHQEATRQATLTALSNTTVWHCSCHGSVKFQTPLDSGLNMAGEGAESILTLRDILALQLTSQSIGGIRLTVLSACETGLPGLSNIDEVVGLPSGLLQAGVAGVVASLWSVGELSTMILLSRFYTLWQTGKMEPSIALRSAQQWLRDAEPSDIIEHCSSFIPDLDRQKELICDLSLDYSDPYHWAAFSYTGV